MKRMILTAALLVLCNAASAATILINPASSTTTLGVVVSVAVRVTDATDLYAYQFDLSFDPTILSTTGVSEGGFLPSGGSTFFLPGTIDNVSGMVTLTAGSLEGAVPGVTGSGTLAVVQLKGLKFGPSPVTLSNIVLLDSTGADIDTTIQNGSVTVVPEPTSVMLLGGGLLAGLIARAYRLYRS